MELILQAGARLEVLHEGGTWVSGVRDAIAQPRLNAEFAPARWLRLRSGWGRTAKVPPLGRLSPASQFFDLVNVNWYANDPAERLAVLTTFLVDPTNPDLGMAVGTKAEAGIEVGMGASVLSLVGFRERIEGAVGIRPEPGWLPRDRFRLADSIPGTGRPPQLVEPPIGADTIPLMVQRPANNTEIRTEGIEVVALLPEIPRLRLRVQAQASWLHTRQEKSDLDFGTASRFQEFQVSPNIPRIPYYENPVRVGRQVLATYRVVHHQPRVGLVITATVQHNLHDENRTEAATDTLAFIGYLTRDGQLTEVPGELRTLPEYADLRRGRAAFTSEQSAPGDWFMNLQVSKTLPLDGRLSFWAFNALDRRGYYGEFGTAARLYPATRFGMELVLPPRALFGGRL
jgi:ferric enterobactin receptor